MSRLEGLGNDQLLIELKGLLKRDRVLEAELISHLGEVEARRLYLEQGCSSMFDYCVKELRFSEGVAYKRIGVARAARRFSGLGLAISRGELHLSAASLIAPHLSQETVVQWLEAACHRTTREIKKLVADRFPRAGVRTSVRRVRSGLKNADHVLRDVSEQRVLQPVGLSPSDSLRRRTAEAQRFVFCTSSASSAATESHRTGSTADAASTEALGAERYSIRFTTGEAVHAQLQELRELLRHSVPDGDVGKILARAIGVLLKQVRKQKIGAGDSPRMAGPSDACASDTRAAKAKPCSSRARTPATRNIPVSIRRAVWARDEGRCSFQSKNGRSCGSREAIEFHHRIPWARCKEHRTDNIALRCRAHNRYEAILDFGIEHMAKFRKEAPAGHSPIAKDLRAIR